VVVVQPVIQQVQMEQVEQVEAVQVNTPRGLLLLEQQILVEVEVVAVRDCRAQQAALALSSSSTQSHRLLRLM
jgi:hypothetical protein